MTPSIQGLGWLLRRTHDPVSLGAFYEKAVGLARLRTWDTPDYQGMMLWAGGVCTFETNVLGDSPQTSAEGSQVIPVFRTRDLEATTQRIVSAGALEIGREEDARANTAFFHDPDGYPLGIEQIKNDSLFPTDRYWSQCEGKLMRVIQMSGDVLGLSRIIHKASDLAIESRFFQKALGLRDCRQNGDYPMLAIGETAMLEIRPSDIPLEIPKHRKDVRDVWIARNYSQNALINDVRNAEATEIQELNFKGGDLIYFTTPSNRMFGFQERKPFDPDEPMTQAIEDIAFRADWLESKDQV